MNTPVRSAWILRALIISITTALLITALTKTSSAMPLGPEDDPLLPSRTLATVTVQSAADDGTAIPANCPSAGCRLRDALAYASAGDTITFSGDYTITLVGELTINKNLTLDGTGHAVTISGNHITRVFNVTAGNVTFTHLTIADGNAQTDDCGTFVGLGYLCGGGIILQNSSVVVTVQNSTLSGNSATGTMGMGGGIYNSHGWLNVTNVIFSGNSAGRYGGGIDNNYGTLNVTNSTFDGNAAVIDGGGIRNWESTLHLWNTLIANSPSGGDCVSDGTTAIVATNDHNLIEATGSYACGLTHGVNGSLIGVDPRLSSLGDYGGNIQTFALLPGSPAIDAGNDATCLTLDQRGVARPQGAACDIGAFESRGFTLTKTGGDNQSTFVNTAFAAPLALSVTSAYTEPVNGGAITFVGPLFGAGTSPITSTAIIAGSAVSQPVIANGIIGGPYNVTARASDVATVTFTLTNTCSNAVTVTNNADSGAGALRQALVDVCAGGTVTFAGDYTITLASELSIDKNMTIDGTGHSVTISGNDAVRVFNVAAGHVTFAYLTITDGTAPITAVGCGGSRCGGGILLQNSGVMVTVTHSTLSGNVAAYDGDNGGGIYNNGGTLMVQDSTLSSNHSGYYGGGIYNNGGTLTIQDSTLAGNHADVGAGVSNAGTLTVINSTLANNLSDDFGSFGNGAGLQNSSGTATLTNVTFSGNQAVNAAGGGVRVDGGDVTLTNVTLSGNSATTGGGISISSGNVTIINSLIANNSAGGNCSGSIGGSNNLADDATCGAGFTNSSSILLGALGDYGGSTLTIPLLPGSAAIDATSTNCPATDQRGVARPQGSACDIGAFEVETYLITPMAGANGSIAPSTAQLVYRGGSQTFLIAPDIGYQTVDVQVDGVSQGAISLYTFNNVMASHTISASFTNETYTLTPSAGAHGSISPATPQTVNHGSSLTFNFTPDAGYQVANVLVDGVPQGTITSYTFSSVTADHTIAVSFGIKTYTIAPSAGAHGTIAPATPQTVNHGGSITFNITPDTGYHISDVIVDGVSQGAIASHTFSNVTANHTIAASFAVNTYTLSPSAGPNGAISPNTPQTVNYGSSKTFNITPNAGYHIADVLVDGVSQGTISSYTFDNIATNHTIAVSFAINTYTITPSAGSNGSISPAAPQTVNHGGSLTFNFTPNPGSQIANVLVDGVSQGAIASYTFSSVTADHTIAVSFTGETYLLTPSAGPNGVISPYAPQTVGYGGSVTFNIAPNTGYHIANVIVDGVSQGAIASHTFSNVTANHTIAASFAINTYTLSPSAGPNGSISPGAPQTVNYGDSKTFNIAANTGYRIADVRVDGVSQGTPGSYTFSNVTANHTITAAFTTSGPQTRMAGVITITADSFTDLGGGLTRAMGHIRLGDHLFLTGDTDVVLYTSTTLTATGKLTVRSDNDQIDVLTGSFRASTSNGSGTLIGTPTYHLNRVADWPLVAGLSVSSIDLLASKMNATANLGVQVYEVDATVPVNFAVAGTNNDIVYSGILGAFDFTLGGITLTVASGATVSNIGITAPGVTLTLPSVLGGASGNINGLSITKYGVIIPDSTITLPEIKYGDGSKLRITDTVANLILANDEYKFTVNSTLYISLPGNLINTPVSFTIANGELTGTVATLDLSIAGNQLGLQDIEISNHGLAVAEATLTLTESLGSAVTTLSDVSISSSGLSIGSGSLQLPEIKIGDGSKVKIINPTATISATTTGYSFGVSGTLQLRLPQNSQDIAINGSIDTDGNFAATLDQIKLKLANVELQLSDIAMDNSGLRVMTGTLQLPAKLGNVSGVVNNVSITASGLSIEGGAATFPIPNFKIGGSTGFSVSNARAKLIMTNNGSSYRLQIDGTVAIAVRGSNASATGTINVDDAGNLSGSVSTFALAVAGLTLNAKNININNDGSLAVEAADLKLPSGFGGAAASVYNVSLGNGEVSIGGGKFTLPEIKAGGFRLKDLGASLIKVTGGYEISAKGFASFPAVSGGAGCKGIGVSATLFVNTMGQMELALAPAQPNGLSLKEAAFNFECQIPIGTTGFSITGLSGAVTLSDTSTQVNVALQIATSRKIADMSVLSADAQAQLISDPFDLSITGAVRVFIFQVGGASAHLTSNNFSATLWVDMKVAKGNIAFNAWSDYRGFHMNGSGSMTVGLAKGAIFNSLSIPYPCCDCGWQWSWGIPYWWCGNCRTCWTEGVTVPPSDWLFDTGTEFGEFSGDLWGVKGTVSLLGYNAGFFIDHHGNLSVGNVDNYRLVQPLQVNQAMQKWQGAQLNGLTRPETAWEVDGIRFADNSIIVNQTLTTTTDVIFALQRNQSAPTLTLMTPLGVEVTPNNLPGNVQFTEVLTYTRNISPTTTPEMAQTINRVSMCVSPQAAQGAEQTALVRLTHARSDLGTIDVLLDGVKAFADLDFGAESSAQVIDSGPHTIELVPANQPGPILYSTIVTITGNSVHRLIAAGDLTTTATLDLVQSTAPAAGQATLRFAPASPDAPNFDVVLGNDGRILFGNVNPWSTTGGVNLEAGKPYTFEVYAAGTNQLLAQLPNITLTGRGTYSLIALGRVTGTPALQLAVQADTLPLSQVRLVNALAADQPITMWTQGITIFAQLPFSATTAYNGFANSSIGLQLTSADISNTLLYSGSFPLQAEADHTLVALDYVTQTQAMLLVDDTHLPSWGKTRVRFVHASPNVPTVDVAVQGGATWFSDIAYMNASDYLELDGGSVTLEVRDHATAGVLLTVPDVNLVDGYVYTLFLMGVNGGSPALQLVPRIDVATVPDIQTQYVVHQAQTGTWGMKLNGDIAATDHYMLTALGSNPAPTLSDLSAGISGETALTTSWRLTSDELGTPIGIYANPGPITAGLFVTDDFIYTGQALATNLSSDDPNWVNGSLQTQSFDLNLLPSGTYHIWVEANDGRNTPMRRYAPEALVVDHAASWPLTWTAVMTLTPGFREVNVQWQPHLHADVDGYVLNVAAPTLSETLVISVGNSTLASVTALDPGRPYSLTLHAVDNETGRVSQSQTVIGIPDDAPFTLNGSTDAINLIAGQSQSLAVTLIAGKEPYPGVAGLQVGCVHQIGADCNLSIGGLTALFAQEIVTPTLAGVAVPVVISSTEQLAAGTYIVPIVAAGNGLSRTFEVAVMLQTQNIAVTAPTAVTLGQDQTLDLPIATAGINGASRSIGLRVDNIPAGLLWSLDRNTLLPGEDAALTITDTALLASGVYTLDIIGDDGLHTSNAHIVLTVSKPRFALTTPSTERIVAFGSVNIATFVLDVTPLDGWAAPVTLVFDPDSAPALGTIGLTRDPAAGVVASTLVVTPTERVYLKASTMKDTPPGQYTLSVEAEAGGRRQTLELMLTVKRMDLYLPLIVRNYVSAPDLVVTSLKASTGNVQVVIKNQGDRPVTDGFYVDVYINPHPAPTVVNQTWSDGRSTQGLTWGVTSPLQPGQALTLTIGDAYYLADYSSFAGTLPIGTPVYAQVDVFDPTTAYGAVRENHEINGAPYNNMLGPVLSTAALELTHDSNATSRGEYFLPVRLKVR